MPFELKLELNGLYKSKFKYTFLVNFKYKIFPKETKSPNLTTAYILYGTIIITMNTIFNKLFYIW